MLRSGLSGLLAGADDLDLRRAVASVEEALEAEGEPADVVAVQDAALHDPRADCARLRATAAREIVVFETAPDLGRLHASVAGGARGFLTADQGIQELREALTVVACGEAALSPALLRALFEQLAEESVDQPERRSEPDLLGLLAAGHSFAEIGHYLGISPKTVRNRSSGLYRSLGVRSRAEAIRRAEELGFLEDEGVA